MKAYIIMTNIYLIHNERYEMHLRWLFILMQNRKNKVVEAITIITTTDTNIGVVERVPRREMEKNHPHTTEVIDHTI